MNLGPVVEDQPIDLITRCQTVAGDLAVKNRELIGS